MINQEIKSEGAIHDLTIEPRRVLEDNRGSVLHMTKSSELLRPIAEVYFSTINPGVTKGWKRHKQMWQRFSVPIGEIEFRFIDERPESPSRGATMAIRTSRKNYCLITVPPGIWYSFKCTSATEALIVNAADMEHNPAESETRPLDL